MEEKKSKVTIHGSKWTPVAVAIIGAFLGSSGTVAVYLGTPIGQEIVRPDPFTGTQAVALEQNVSRLEHGLEQHLTNHPDDVNQFDRRIAVLESQYAIILQNQGRILDRLDSR